MGYLFEINKTTQGQLRIKEEFKELIPEFAGLTAPEMRWIILMYDNESPYRKVPEEERIKKVTRDIFGRKNHVGKVGDGGDWKSVWNNKKIKEASEKYQELCYDPLMEQLKGYDIKINEFAELLKHEKMTADNAMEFQKMMSLNDKIIFSRERLQEAIEKRGPIRKISGGNKMSYIESKYHAGEEATLQT